MEVQDGPLRPERGGDRAVHLRRVVHVNEVGADAAAIAAARFS